MIKIIVINPNEARYVLAGILTLLICCLGLQLLINKPSLHLLLSTNHLGVDQDCNTFICYPSTGGLSHDFNHDSTSNHKKTPLKGPNQTTSGPQISKQYGGGEFSTGGIWHPISLLGRWKKPVKLLLLVRLPTSTKQPLRQHGWIGQLVLYPPEV